MPCSLTPRASGKIDLDVFGDLDALLSRCKDVALRDPVRMYYKVIYLVHQIRRVKWFIFFLFLSQFIKCQFNVFIPSLGDGGVDQNTTQTQATVALAVSLGAFGVLWLVEYAVSLFAVHPSELFCVPGEELALAAAIGELIVNANKPVVKTNGQDYCCNLGALFKVDADLLIKMKNHQQEIERQKQQQQKQAAPASDDFNDPSSETNSLLVRSFRAGIQFPTQLLKSSISRSK